MKAQLRVVCAASLCATAIDLAVAAGSGCSAAIDAERWLADHDEETDVDASVTPAIGREPLPS